MRKPEVLVLEKNGSGAVMDALRMMKRYRVTRIDIDDAGGIRDYLDDRRGNLGCGDRGCPRHGPPVAVLIDGMTGQRPDSGFLEVYGEFFRGPVYGHNNLIVSDFSAMTPDDFVYVRRKMNGFRTRRKQGVLEVPVEPGYKF
jgi:hypothetical protein